MVAADALNVPEGSASLDVNFGVRLLHYTHTPCIITFVLHVSK